MVSLDDAVVARYARFGHQFEILVDPDAAEKVTAKLRAEEEVGREELLEILAADDIFTHWSDGKRASSEQLEKAFETEDLETITKRILLEGEIQLTADQRKKMGEQKRARILDTILRNCWNPQTKTPHPRERIERALDEAKFRVDPVKGVEPQVEEALKKLRPLLPIAWDTVKIAIKVPAEHTGHTYGVIRGLGDVQREEWQKDGALVVLLEIPAGMQGEVYDRLNALTHGNVETRLVP